MDHRSNDRWTVRECNVTHLPATLPAAELTTDNAMGCVDEVRRNAEMAATGQLASDLVLKAAEMVEGALWR